MKRAFLLLIIPLLLFGCKQEEKSVEEECENFQFLEVSYPGEKVRVSFNSEIIYENSYKEKGGYGLHRFCVDYTSTFNVNLLVVKGERTVLDTTMVGYLEKGKYLLRLPMGDPKPHLVERVWADSTGNLYESIPKDSLVRTAFLQTGLIITD